MYDTSIILHVLNKIITRIQTDSRMVKVTSLTAEGNCQFSKIQRRYMFIHINYHYQSGVSKP